MQISVQIPPDWRRLLCVTPFVIVVDAAWYTTWFALKDTGVYPVTIWDDLALWAGVLAWLPPALAVSMGEPATLREALGFGAWVGFLLFAVYSGVELVFDAEWRASWWSSIVDICWGTFMCGSACCFGFWAHKRCFTPRSEDVEKH
mmetsp:Transcript_834/g.1606  ORF Transcript_834/g.1606 Transcript_834/m.1606 type:complete len:146 (+) Transcript_834:68-505(+)